MQFVIKRETTEVAYLNETFWKQYDRVTIEEPEGWVLRFTQGGIVHTFDYCQSTGRGEYIDEYREETVEKPLHFTENAQKNAEILQALHCKDCRAVLLRQVK